jgi:hypothetical protein
LTETTIAFSRFDSPSTTMSEEDKELSALKEEKRGADGADPSVVDDHSIGWAEFAELATMIKTRRIARRFEGWIFLDAMSESHSCHGIRHRING